MKTKRKRLWMTAIAALFLAAYIGGCRDENVEKVGVCPLVLSTSPVNGATGVSLDKIITVTFNEKMNPATITQASLSLMNTGIATGRMAVATKNSETEVSGTVTYESSSNTMSFIPSLPLSPYTNYSGTVATTVKDLMGNALQVDYVWTFNTGASPTVTSTNPANNATGVVLTKTVTVTLSEPMDSLTLTAATFILKQGTTTIGGTFSHTDTTVTFTPSINLLTSTTYTATITTGAKSMQGIPLANDYVWTFNTGSLPAVNSTNPANNATGVVLNKIINASFSEPMDSSTLTATTFTLFQGATSIAGTVSHTDTTVFFTPSGNLLPGTTYTATITTGAKSVHGIPLANNYVWTFNTGALPTVTSTNPANNATGVDLNKVTATFNMTMDPLTLTATTFTLKHGATSVTGTVSYSAATASFVPSGNLLAGTTYTATITTGAKSQQSIPLANDYVWTFTTGFITAPSVTSTDPADNDTGVALNKIVTATFSEPMDPLTLTSTTFTIIQGATPVAGTVSYSGTTATFTPSGNLLASAIFTATITTGAKNVQGIALAIDNVWTFTTGSVAAPNVNSTNPVNNASGVVLNKIITATFSEPMDPLTLTANFILKHGATPVAGTISYTDTTASFTPTINLLSGTTYTATITTGAKNLGGIPLANDYVWKFNTTTPLGALPVNLKSVARFGIIAGVGVSNNAGFSEIHNMDVGISPGVRSSITGFPPAIIVNGAMYASDDIAPPGIPAMLTQAKQDLTDAYLFAEGATFPAPATVAGDQGGKTLAPGIYKSTSTLLIQSGDLTLDAQGDANAVWIFQIASDFTTVGGAGGNVILSGGAQAKNVFWQTGSSATIGDFTSFKGNILALTSITMNSGATAVGRMLARNGAVVLTSTNIINKP